MGPILIFDKSFLESLTLDESVLLDNFFLINITPIFFVETLADLEKKYKKGKIKRTSNELVKELASKTPDNGTPNVHHQTLVIQDLLGHYVEMSSRIIVAGGQTRISPDGKVGVFFEGFPEYIALERWRYGDYLEGEKDFAKEWRSTLLNVSFNWGINQVKEILPKGIRFSSVEQVRDFVNNYIKKRNIEVLYLLFEILQIPYATRISILTRWNRSRPESLLQFSRYASYVFKIDLFFYICLQFNLIGSIKTTNKIDLSYLYYLPFCQIFVSNDNLHARITHLFMENNQTFVKGDELKEGLKSLNDYFSKHIKEIEKEGLLRFASTVPNDVKSSVLDLHDKYLTKRRQTSRVKEPIDPKEEKELIEFFRKREEESIPVSNRGYRGEPDSMTLKRRVRVRKGKWRILPEGIESKKNNS